MYARPTTFGNTGIIVCANISKQNEITYAERPVIKPPVLSTLEEVSVAISVLQGSVDIVRNAFPVGERLGVRRLHWRPLGRVEPPEFGAFVEVDFAVA